MTGRLAGWCAGVFSASGQCTGRKNRETARSPIFSPCTIPSFTALRKWNPMRMRDSPFSAAARENLGKWRSTWEVPPHRFSGMGSVLLHRETDLVGAEERGSARIRP